MTDIIPELNDDDEDMSVIDGYVLASPGNSRDTPRQDDEGWPQL